MNPAPKHNLPELLATIAAGHAAMVESLTVAQFCDALRQMIASGDFVRYVTPDGAQRVVYEPFRELERLRADKARLDWLESRLTPGTFLPLRHYDNASNFWGGWPPAGWSKQTPITIGDSSSLFGASLREAIDLEMLTKV